MGVGVCGVSGEPRAFLECPPGRPHLPSGLQPHRPLCPESQPLLEDQQTPPWEGRHTSGPFCG